MYSSAVFPLATQWLSPRRGDRSRRVFIDDHGLGIFDGFKEHNFPQRNHTASKILQPPFNKYRSTAGDQSKLWE